MITIQSPVPPAIAHIGDRTIVVPSWVEVPAGTTLDMIHWERPILVKSEVAQHHVGKYIIHVHGNGRVTCECPGYMFRKKCKHSAQFIG